MSIETNDRDKLKQIGRVEYIAEGVDSYVERITDDKNLDVAVKEYRRLNSAVGPEEAKLILRQYFADTEKIATAFGQEPNPLRQSVIVNGTTIPLHYKIVPQGGVMLRGRQNAPIVTGQKFIEGGNLNETYTYSYKQQKLLGSYYVQEQLHSAIEDLGVYINHTFQTKFDLAFGNVKPVFNEQENRIELTITDLASDLRKSYQETK